MRTVHGRYVSRGLNSNNIERSAPLRSASIGIRIRQRNRFRGVKFAQKLKFRMTSVERLVPFTPLEILDQSERDARGREHRHADSGATDGD